MECSPVRTVTDLVLTVEPEHNDVTLSRSRFTHREAHGDREFAPKLGWTETASKLSIHKAPPRLNSGNRIPHAYHILRLRMLIPNQRSFGTA